MKYCKTVEKLARLMCKQLYEFTNGQPGKWQTIVGVETIGDVMDYAVERGWLVVDSEGIKICLTDEGRRMVRAGLS
jgi:hypothetical protein